MNWSTLTKKELIRLLDSYDDEALICIGVEFKQGYIGFYDISHDTETEDKFKFILKSKALNEWYKEDIQEERFTREEISKENEAFMKRVMKDNVTNKVYDSSLKGFDETIKLCNRLNQEVEILKQENKMLQYNIKEYYNVDKIVNKRFFILTDDEEDTLPCIRDRTFKIKDIYGHYKYDDLEEICNTFNLLNDENEELKQEIQHIYEIAEAFDYYKNKIKELEDDTG